MSDGPAFVAGACREEHWKPGSCRQHETTARHSETSTPPQMHSNPLLHRGYHPYPPTSLRIGRAQSGVSKWAERDKTERHKPEQPRLSRACRAIHWLAAES